jgi:hypothetical protein
MPSIECVASALLGGHAFHPSTLVPHAPPPGTLHFFFKCLSSQSTTWPPAMHTFRKTKWIFFLKKLTSIPSQCTTCHAYTCSYTHTLLPLPYLLSRLPLLIYMYTYMYIYIYVYMYCIYIYIYIYICMYCVCVYMYVCMYIYVCVYICILYICINAYSYTRPLLPCVCVC